MSPLALFESMHALSSTMVAAAQANDWDQLAAVEQQMAEVRNEVMRADQQGTQAAPLSDADAARKQTLINEMLENDREIRRHVEPWLASTRKLLSSAVRDRTVRAAYGAFGPP